MYVCILYAVDVNECSVKNLCSTNATCANTNGSFICTCNPGFSGNGLTCDGMLHYGLNFLLFFC